MRPSQIITREAFENAVAGVAASGGSTNAVLHLIALAREVGIPLTLDDIDEISRRTPIVATSSRAGSYNAPDLHAAGGIAAGRRPSSRKQRPRSHARR